MIIKLLQRKKIENNILMFIKYNNWKSECYKTGQVTDCPILGMDTTPLWMGYQDLNFLNHYNVNKDLIDLELESIKNAKTYYYKSQKIIDLEKRRDELFEELTYLEKEIDKYNRSKTN